MPNIRPEQLDALRQAALSAYRGELLVHYRGFAPELMQVAGEERFVAFIRYGTDKAMHMGLTLRGPMRLLLDAM